MPYSADGYYRADNQLPQPSDMAICGLPYEGGQSAATGQSMAPFHIRRYENFDSWQAHDIGDLSTVKVVDCGDALIRPSQAAYDLRSAQGWLGRIAANTGCLVALGGDHSVSALTIETLWGSNEGVTIDVVQFDAHTDTWQYDAEDEFPGHESWVRWIVDKGYVGTVWQYGVRGMGPDDHRSVPNVRTTTGQVHDQKTFSGFLKWHEANRPDRKLHLSVDLDVVDPAYAPAVSYPEPGGWTPYVLLNSIERIVSSGRVIGVDITEITPSLDRQEMSVRLAHRSVLAVMRGIKRAQAKGGAE